MIIYYVILITLSLSLTIDYCKNNYSSIYKPESFNPTIICLASINTVDIIIRKLIIKCKVLLNEKQ